MCRIFHLKLPVTGVSAVGLFGSFVLSLPAQVFAWLFWRDHSDPAAYARH